MKLQRLFAEEGVPGSTGVQQGLPDSNGVSGRTPVPNLMGSPIPSRLPLDYQDPNMLNAGPRAMAHAADALSGFGQTLGQVAAQTAKAEMELQAKVDKADGITAVTRAEQALAEADMLIQQGDEKSGVPPANHQDYLPKFKATAEEIRKRARESLQTEGARREFDVKWGAAYLGKFEGAVKHRVGLIKDWANGQLEAGTQAQLGIITSPLSTPEEIQRAKEKIGELRGNMKGLIPDKELEVKKKEVDQYIDDTLATRAAYENPKHFEAEGYKAFPNADQKRINQLREDAEKRAIKKEKDVQDATDRLRLENDRRFKDMSDQLGKQGADMMYKEGKDIRGWLESNQRLLLREEYEKLHGINHTLTEARKKQDFVSDPKALTERDTQIRFKGLRDHNVITEDTRLNPASKAHFYALIDSKLGEERAQAKAGQSHAETLANQARKRAESYIESQLPTPPFDPEDEVVTLRGQAVAEFHQMMDKDPKLNPDIVAEEVATRFRTMLEQRGKIEQSEALSKYSSPEQVHADWKAKKITTVEANRILRAMKQQEQTPSKPSTPASSGSRKPAPKQSR